MPSNNKPKYRDVHQVLKSELIDKFKGKDDLKSLKDLKHHILDKIPEDTELENNEQSDEIFGLGDTDANTFCLKASGNLNLSQVKYTDDETGKVYKKIQLGFIGKSIPHFTVFKDTENNNINECKYDFCYSPILVSDNNDLPYIENLKTSLTLDYGDNTDLITVGFAEKIIEPLPGIKSGINSFLDFICRRSKKIDPVKIEKIKKYIGDKIDALQAKIEDETRCKVNKITIKYSTENVEMIVPIPDDTLKISFSQKLETGNLTISLENFPENDYFILEKISYLYSGGIDLKLEELVFKSTADLDFDLWSEGKLQFRDFGIKYKRDDSFFITHYFHLTPSWHTIPWGVGEWLGKNIPSGFTIEKICISPTTESPYVDDFDIKKPSLQWAKDKKEEGNISENAKPHEKYKKSTSLAEGYTSLSKNFGLGLSLDGITIKKKTETGKISLLGIFCGLKFSMGPVAVTVEGVGISIDAFYADTPDEDDDTEDRLVSEVTLTSARYVTHDFDVPFIDQNMDLGIGVSALLPTGFGIDLKLSSVKASGYLLREGTTFKGAMSVNLFDKVQLTAVGILEEVEGTQCFTIAICTQFPAGIPLGLNFYLKGVGGLIGYNRTMDLDKLRSGIQEGAIDNVAFPDTETTNIATIINDLQRFFPGKKDQFVVGPMARITWSNPAMITLDIGILLEFPDPARLAILGVLKTALPHKKKALVAINAGFLGVLDFDNQMISFDAALYKSKLVKFELFGDLCFRLSWGDQKAFVISAGGFHPSYCAPRFLNIPTMRRLTIVFHKKQPRIILESYLAVTSNTFQLGSRASLEYKKCGAKVTGHIGFNTLFQFDPFAFIADFSAGVKVRVFGKTLCGVSVRGDLSGPTPWKVYAKVKVSLGWFGSVSASVSTKWGDETKEPVQIIDIKPLLIRELEKKTNWSITDNRDDDVAICEPDDIGEEATIYLAPNGDLVFNQNVLPFDKTLECFGSAKPRDLVKVSISSVYIGDVKADKELIQNEFPTTFFEDLKGDEGNKKKLTAPDFTNYDSGFKADAKFNGKFAEDKPVQIIPEYKVEEFKPVITGGYTFKFPQFEGFKLAEGSSVAKTVYSKKTKLQKKSREFYVRPPKKLYDIVFSNGLRKTELQGFTKSEAQQKIYEIETKQPMLKGELIPMVRR